MRRRDPRPTIIREMTRIDLPKSNEFKGMRDAREVENLWKIERYFEGQGVVEEAIKVRIALLYFSNNATLCWVCLVFFFLCHLAPAQ